MLHEREYVILIVPPSHYRWNLQFTTKSHQNERFLDCFQMEKRLKFSNDSPEKGMKTESNYQYWDCSLLGLQCFISFRPALSSLRIEIIIIKVFLYDYCFIMRRRYLSFAGFHFSSFVFEFIPQLVWHTQDWSIIMILLQHSHSLQIMLSFLLQQ